ncbi:DUF6600 domain-containing protein [Steroidobacter cummioxidans]|uniref:DUF6600 domain-containing protein n=1 Tax=Steroidobacter cummioxidans TaxID=1803913 RepID=UPI000E322607|nr:DUF6600 domain-containing protein [Steroidobacter cummioxidans]
MILGNADRRLTDRSSGQLPGSRYVTNYLTQWLTAFVCSVGLLLAFGSTVARAQQPVVEPEPVVESEPTVEPVIEPETAAQSSESSSRAAPVVDPPSRVARLGYVDGDVTVAPAGSDEWADAALNRPLTSGDRLWVEDKGRAELQIGSAAVYLDGDTGFGLIELDDHVLQASLTEGVATIRVRRLAEGETIQIETPHSTVHLNRVGEYSLEVDKSADRTIVKTRNGEADVSGGGNEHFTVRDNERGVFTGVEALSGTIEPLGPRTAFENWANDRDARNERSQSAQYVSRDVIGYEDLDDNGEWISEPEYGYVWRPTYVVSNWAPYRYGRWVYVSPWGWSWIDDARWGFAPFHYGRWAYIRSNWCWVPGPRHIRPVYAPALVGWVGGPTVGVSVSFGNVGWYPLGPRDVFYPGYRHTPRYIRYVNVSNTVVINNNYFYGRRLPPPHFDYHRYPGAVTSVPRDYFVGGRRIGDHWVRPDDNQMRNWHGVREPPAIAPYRESVLGGAIRRPPRDVDRFNNMGRGDYYAGRMPFHRERSAIESNGNRPIGRAELVQPAPGPKRYSDFNVNRPTGKNPDVNRYPALGSSGGSNRPRELNNDSVREWQSRRDRDNRTEGLSRPGNSFSTPTPQPGQRERDRSDARDRVRSMPAEESSNIRRNDPVQRVPSNGYQQNGTGFYRPPSNSNFREREPSRSPGSGGSGLSRTEPRQYTPAPSPRSEPPRTISAPPRSEPRNFSPPPRQAAPPSHSQPSRAAPPSNSSPGVGNGGGHRGGGNRSWNTPRER